MYRAICMYLLSFIHTHEESKGDEIEYEMKEIKLTMYYI